VPGAPSWTTIPPGPDTDGPGAGAPTGGVVIGHGAGAPPASRRDAGARPRRRGRVLVAIFAVLLVVAGGLAVAGMSGRGPLRGALGRSATTGESGGPRTTAPTRAPTPLSLSPGDCVTWGEGPDARLSPTTVGCDQPHFLEITGNVRLDGIPEAYPSPGDWSMLVGERCQLSADLYYGAKLDPEGLFTPGGLWPDEVSWQQGDRQMWCGIEAARSDNSQDSGAFGLNSPSPVTGTAKGREQYRVYNAGECLSGSNPEPVACNQPHETEVVGETTLSDRQNVPAVADRAAWQALVGSNCDKLARTYLGRAPKAPMETSWLAITSASWQAGKRNVTCVLGNSTPSGWATVNTSVKNR
jgi:hypothetical protein